MPSGLSATGIPRQGRHVGLPAGPDEGPVGPAFPERASSQWVRHLGAALVPGHSPQPAL